MAWLFSWASKVEFENRVEISILTRNVDHDRGSYQGNQFHVTITFMPGRSQFPWTSMPVFVRTTRSGLIIIQENLEFSSIIFKIDFEE